jgi:hypothetical protein
MWYGGVGGRSEYDDGGVFFSVSVGFLGVVAWVGLGYDLLGSADDVRSRYAGAAQEKKGWASFF